MKFFVGGFKAHQIRKIKRATNDGFSYQTRDDIRMRKRDGIIFWPAYFEKSYTREEGRRIPTNLAAEGVNIEILEAAAKYTGFDYDVEPAKRYPKKWSEKRGYVVLDNPEGHKKKRLMLMLAKGVRRAVAKRDSARLEAQKKKRKGKQKKPRK